MKYLILLLTGITSTICYAFPDDIEKLVQKKVKDERNWMSNNYEFRKKNLSEYYTNENLSLSSDLREAKMNVLFQESTVSVNKTIAEKSQDPKKRAEYKKMYEVSNKKLKELEQIHNEKVCPAVKYAFSYYVFQKANQRFARLSSLQISRDNLEDLLRDYDYSPCIKELEGL